MAFRCPQCKTTDSLEIMTSIELPPDYRSTDISLQVVECSLCPFRGLAVYEEPRLGRREASHHTGYWVSPDAVEAVLTAIQACPDRYNPRCQCRIHCVLGQADPYGPWRGLLEMERSHTFTMRMAV